MTLVEITPIGTLDPDTLSRSTKWLSETCQWERPDSISSSTSLPYCLIWLILLWCCWELSHSEKFAEGRLPGREASCYSCPFLFSLPTASNTAWQIQIDLSEDGREPSSNNLQLFVKNTLLVYFFRRNVRSLVFRHRLWVSKGLSSSLYDRPFPPPCGAVSVCSNPSTTSMSESRGESLQCAPVDFSMHLWEPASTIIPLSIVRGSKNTPKRW